MPAASSQRIQTIAAELRAVLGQIKRRLREEASAGDINLSQLAVLGRLYRDGPATVTQLARAESMRPQSMGAIVASLQEAGHVTGTPHPTDGRQTLFALTPSCSDWLKARRAAREDWLSCNIQAHLSPAEQQTLAEAIGLLKRLCEA